MSRRPSVWWWSCAYEVPLGMGDGVVKFLYFGWCTVRKIAVWFCGWLVGLGEMIVEYCKWWKITANYGRWLVKDFGWDWWWIVHAQGWLLSLKRCHHPSFSCGLAASNSQQHTRALLEISGRNYHLSTKTVLYGQVAFIILNITSISFQHGSCTSMPGVPAAAKAFHQVLGLVWSRHAPIKVWKSYPRG